MSNVTKSSASDDLLHVNCKVTNRTQTCFRSTQIVNCLPGVWVLVSYWRPFYFIVVIVESLLRIFVFHSFCFRCSAVCFGAFCTEGNAIGFKFRFDMRYSIKSAKSHSAKCSLYKINGRDEAQHQSQLVWNAQIWSIFTSQRVDSAGTLHGYVLGCLWIVTVCCNTVGRHGYSFLSTTRIHIQWTS